ncbi:MAG: tetratricopeptide repeat protein [Polyangiaceae bacterium]
MLLLASAASAPAAGASSADELVLQARAHEATHEDDIAVRRYSDALMLDPTNVDAWLGLGALRVKLGDPVEADRVYSAALERVPSLRRALLGRARARWALGHHVEAEEDLETFAAQDGDLGALRELAGWFGSDGRTPAQLATWRRLLAAATRLGDAALAAEARRMVRALVILVDGADPASSPVDPDPARQAMARIARRGG